MDEGKTPGPKPKWWSRPGTSRPAAPTPDRPPLDGPPRESLTAAAGERVGQPDGEAAPTDAGPGDTMPADAAPTTPPPAAGRAGGPLHDPDPYATPPYGDPGPWAPAPPVQHPGMTPAHGTPLPPAAFPPPVPQPPQMTPAQGTPVPAGAALPHAGATAAEQWRHYDPWGTSVPVRPVPAGGRSRPGGRLVVGALLIALVAGGVGGGVGVYLERNGGVGGHRVELSQAPADTTPPDPGSVAGIAAKALPSVVTIHVSGESAEGTGTGFVLDKGGHILTNNHVVEPAGAKGDISVTFHGGEVAAATVVGRDSGYDLAVIKVKNVSGLRPLPLGNSDSVRVGDPVVAIGAPYDLAGTVTSGIISATERPITAGGENGDGSDVSYVDALQTDAPINPGNSGGPLVDSKARVIGINSAIRAADEGAGLNGSQGGSIGLGFAIPINQGKRVAEELINSGQATHPVIGVTLDMGYPGDGARVNTKGAGGSAPVKPDGPGDRAGIRPGDVITEVDGVRVHSGQELIVKIRSHRPGDRLRLTVERDDQERTVGLTLGSASGD